MTCLRVASSIFAFAYGLFAYATQRKKKVDELQSELVKLEEKLLILEKELQLVQMGREKSVSTKLNKVQIWHNLHLCTGRSLAID